MDPARMVSMYSSIDASSWRVVKGILTFRTAKDAVRLPTYVAKVMITVNQ